MILSLSAGAARPSVGSSNDRGSGVTGVPS
jgi:hypothetical protein